MFCNMLSAEWVPEHRNSQVHTAKGHFCEWWPSLRKDSELGGAACPDRDMSSWKLLKNISKAFLTLACHSMSFILDGRPAPRARHFFKDLLRISHAAGKREVDQGLFLHYLRDFARSELLLRLNARLA